MEQVIDLQSGGELRQDVVRNDRFSLSGIAPEGWGRGVSMYQKGVSMYRQKLVFYCFTRGRVIMSL